jgi:CHASE1-domain containing sensor protein
MINGKKGKYFILLLVLASGILFSLVLFYWTYKAEQAGMQSRFNEIAGHRFKDIEDVVQYNTVALESFGGLYASSETVTGQEFDTFA